MREKWDELSCAYRRPSAIHRKNAKTRISNPVVTTTWTTARSRQGFRGEHESFEWSSEIHWSPSGCTSGDIADALQVTPRQRVLQSKQVTSEWACGSPLWRGYADISRAWLNTAEAEPQPVRETRPVRNFLCRTNDPRVILLPDPPGSWRTGVGGLYRRAATVWMAAFRESHSPARTNNFLARREQCLRKTKPLHRVKSGICQGNYVGETNDDVNSMPAAGAGYAEFLTRRTWLPANQSGGWQPCWISFRWMQRWSIFAHWRKKGVITIKRWRGQGITLRRGEGTTTAGGQDYPRSLLVGKTPGLRALHWVMRGAEEVWSWFCLFRNVNTYWRHPAKGICW